MNKPSKQQQPAMDADTARADAVTLRDDAAQQNVTPAERYLADLPRLEEKLMGLELDQLVAELAGRGRAPLPPTSDDDSAVTRARELFGGHAETVLERGLAALPTVALRRLLADPVRLYNLQELLLTEGGPHWTAVAQSLPEVQSLRLSVEELTDRFTAPREPIRPRIEGSAPDPTGPRPPKIPWRIRSWLLLMGASLGLLLAVGLYFVQSRRLADRELAHADELATLRQEFAQQRRRETADRLVAACRSLDRLSELPAIEWLGELPPTTSDEEAFAGPPVEEGMRLTLPVSETPLAALSPREAALTEVLAVLRQDAEAAEALRAGEAWLLAHPDAAVRHGAELARQQIDCPDVARSSPLAGEPGDTAF